MRPDPILYWVCKLSVLYSFSTAQQKQGSVEDLLYDVDLDGSSLLHLAANSGVLAVQIISS